MKRSLIALGVAAAVALPVVAQANPKVYGKINLSTEYQTTEVTNQDDVESTALVSNASRFGVRGDTELAAGLSVIYQLEWEVSADGDGTDLKARNRFVGLQNESLGTVKLGQYDSYLKLSEGKVDQFNDYFGDMEFIVAGQNRLANVIGYESPKFAGLRFNAMAQTQDAANAPGTNAAGGDPGVSTSVVFDDKDLGLYAALAYDHNMVSKTAVYGTRESDILRLVVGYAVGDLALGGLYSTSEAVAGSNTEEKAWLLSAAYKLSDVTLKAQYGMADGDNDQEKTLWSLGGDYKLGSKTKAFAFYSMREHDNGAGVDNDKSSIALGLEHSF